MPELTRAWFALDDDGAVVVHPGLSVADSGVDLVVLAGDHTFSIQVKGTDNIASLERSRPCVRARESQNLEPDFAAIVTEALPLAFTDCIAVPLEGTTVLGEKAARSVRVCGPAAASPRSPGRPRP